MFAQLLSVFAASVALANAYPPPVGDPSGNPITRPGLNEIVPAGQPYTISWQPTTADNIALVLLRGPSTNVVPIATIVDNIPNSGSYVWTPSTDLEPDTTHYGLQLICDDTGAYQYSTQFGISNPNYSNSSSSSSSSASMSGSMSASMTSSMMMSGNSSMSMTSSSASMASTGMPANSSIVSPTASMSVPTSLGTSTTTKATGATKASSSSSSSATSSSGAGSTRLSVGGAVAALAVAVAAL